jgi:hypothetical protein
MLVKSLVGVRKTQREEAFGGNIPHQGFRGDSLRFALRAAGKIGNLSEATPLALLLLLSSSPTSDTCPFLLFLLFP